MHQVSSAELDANLCQLAEMVPIEILADGFNHGMVYGNVTVAYLSEEEWLTATIEQRAEALRRAYVNCLRSAIDHATALLEEMAVTGKTDTYKQAAKQIAASIEKGHDVLEHGEDFNEEEA